MTALAKKTGSAGLFCCHRRVACPGSRRLTLPCRCPAGWLALFAVRLPCRCGVRRGACPLCRLSALPLVCFLSPIPPTPFPAGRGRFFSFLMQGASPLASPRLNPRGAYNPCQAGARRGACPGGTGYPCRLRPRRGAQGGGRLPALPLWCPQGGLAPARHLLVLPRGRGPSQTPKFLSPGPPSPWLPALPPVNKQKPLVVQVPRPSQLRGCKGRSPLHKKTLILPLPRRGRGLGG